MGKRNKQLFPRFGLYYIAYNGVDGKSYKELMPAYSMVQSAIDYYRQYWAMYDAVLRYRDNTGFRHLIDDGS